jgi:hypothetical protein
MTIYANALVPLHSSRITDIRIRKFRTYSNRQEAEMVQYVLRVELEPIRKRKGREQLWQRGISNTSVSSLVQMLVIWGVVS